MLGKIKDLAHDPVAQAIALVRSGTMSTRHAAIVFTGATIPAADALELTRLQRFIANDEASASGANVCAGTARKASLRNSLPILIRKMLLKAA